MSIKIRPYRAPDSMEVGQLIAETFREFNLSYAQPEEQEKLLGPFRHAHSNDEARQRDIAAVICAPTVLVAVEDNRTVGVLRGSPGRLHSLFVQANDHQRGIGRHLMTVFEQKIRKTGHGKITLQSSLYAVPFYQALGYKRSTGIRSGSCFDGTGFKYQPMKKLL